MEFHPDAGASGPSGAHRSLRLLGSATLSLDDGTDGVSARATFILRRGEVADFVLSDGGDAKPVPLEEAEPLLQACLEHWRGWTSRMRYRGRWRETVTRSALALKLLISSKHGSIAAAATFGLPEAAGGPRNWDYRATWIRDAW